MKQFSGSAWRTASYSGSQGDCVEVAHTEDAVGVRDTKNRPAGHITLSSDAWRVLIGHASALSPSRLPG